MPGHRLILDFDMPTKISLQQFGDNLKAKYGDTVLPDGRKYSEVDSTEAAERYIKKHPEYSQHVDTYNDKTAGFFSRLGHDIGERSQQIQDTKESTNTSSFLDTARGTLHNLGEAAGVITTDIPTEAAKSISRTVAGEAPEKAVEGMMQSFGESDAGKALGSLMQKYPEATKDVEAVANILGLIPAFKGLQMAGKGVKAGAEAAYTAARGGETAVAKATADKELQYALEQTMPKSTLKTSEEAIRQGRFTDPGMFRSAKETASAYDNQVAESVSDVISSKHTPTQNVEAMAQKISQTNQGVREMIAERKMPFNTNQLRSKLANAKDDLRIIFASDASAERIYNSVVDEFLKHTSKMDTLGLFDARQTFDKIPAIKKLLDTERAGENLRKEIALTVRRAANEYIADQLPTNNPYRSAILQESKMIQALENFSERNAHIIGKNKLQLINEKYPLLKWVVGGLGLGGGVGAGGAAIMSTDF